jgi:hypothetical protein
MNFKNFEVGDIALFKFSIFFGTLFLVSVWSGFADWVIQTHWGWFLAVSLILAVKPIIKVFSK